LAVIATIGTSAAGHYDLVLMDIQMPRMDGITATRRIRALGGPAAEVPIVAMTANVLPEQVREFLAAGMDGHVAKPVRQAELQSAIASALAARPASRRELGDQAQTAEAQEGPPTFDAATFAEVREMLPRERLAAHLERLAGEVELVAAGSGPDGNAENLAGAAHKIVSQAGMLGLMRLSERAREVEEAARSAGAGEALETALSRFRQAAVDVTEAERALG
jgi:response regulator RpfG family c-di-GMP phosphodiesterase